MTYFLEDVARYLYDLNKGDLRNLIVVFPNRRARLFFNKYLSGFSDKPTWAPQYYSISEYIQKLSGLQLADQLTLIFKLFQTYKEVTGSNEAFDTFYFYCEMILSDFNDIDKNLVDAGKLYQNLSDLKEIEGYYDYLTETQINEIKRFWQIFVSSRKSDERDQFIAIWDALKLIYIRFNEILEKEGIAYEGKAYRSVINKMKNNEIELSHKNQIVFAGFNALNHSEEILFDYLKKTGISMFFWDYDESYINSDIHEAGFFLRNYIRRFPQPADFNSKNTREKKKIKLKSVSVPSNISQAKVLGTFLKEQANENFNNPGQTAIILTDENLLLPVLNSLPKEIEKVNISMGYPVVDTPVYNFIIQLADVRKNKKYAVNGEQLVYYKDFFGILEHNYLESITITRTYKDFKKNAREKNHVYINPIDFVTDNQLYAVIFSELENPKAFGKYLTDILQLVASTLVNKGTEKIETRWHLEIIYSIFKVLMRFDSLLMESGIEISFSTVLRLLKTILKGISVPFAGEPLSGIQLLGILETRTLDFKNLIFLSMNEGKYPKAGHSPTMIPYSLREGFGLPTINHQDAIYAYYFYRLLHRAESVTMLHNTKSDGLQKGEESRYLLQLKYNPDFDLEEIVLGYHISATPDYGIIGKKDSEIMLKLEKYLNPGGCIVMSPSALNVYLNCKLRFYFRYIEEMKEPDEIEEEIESNVFGSILHKTINLLYEDFKGKILNKEDIRKIKTDVKLIRSAVNKAFAEEYLHADVSIADELKGRNLIIRKVIEKYIYGILEFDLQFAPIKIISLEEKYVLELKIPDTNYSISIGGFIDRLDNAAGFTRVIDYKTGQVKDKFDSIDELYDAPPTKRNHAVFQTFVYSLIVQSELKTEKIVPSLFYVRNIHQKDFDYKIKSGKEYIDDFKEFHQPFQQRLMELIKDIFNPQEAFTQTNDVKYCKNCPYNDICMRKD